MLSFVHNSLTKWSTASVLLLAVSGCAVEPSAEVGEIEKGEFDAPEPEAASSDVASGPSRVAIPKSLAATIAANKSVEAQLHLVERVVASDALIEFYEPEPGEISVSVVGAAGGRVPSIDDGMPAEAIFGRFAGKRSKSPQFEAALERRDGQRSNAKRDERAPLVGDEIEPTEGESGGSPIAPSLSLDTTTASIDPPGHCNWKWLVENVCGTRGHSWDYEWETAYWWHGRTIMGTNRRQARGVVCADIGNVTFSATDYNGNGGNWTVLEDTYRYYYKNVSALSNDFDILYQVLDAAHDRFHTCGYFHG